MRRRWDLTVFGTQSMKHHQVDNVLSPSHSWGSEWKYCYGWYHDLDWETWAPATVDPDRVVSFYEHICASQLQVGQSN